MTRQNPSPRLIVLSLVTAFVAVLSAPSVHALSCAWGPYEMSPQSGDTDVPTNALLYFGVSAQAQADAVLAVAQSGETVAGEVESHGDAFAFRPSEALAPNTAYVLTLRGPEEQEGAVDVEFTTGAGPALDAPAAPELLDVEYVADSSEWGDTAHVHITVQSDSVLTEYQLAKNEDFSDAESFVRAHDEAYIGIGLCETSYAAVSDGPTYVRVRSLSAGGTSEFVTHTSPVEPIALPFGGCSQAGGSSSMLGFAMALCLVAVRRRRTR